MEKMETAYSNVTVDFKLLNGIILIEAAANDEHGCFAFDTGAMKTALHRKYFPTLHGKELEIAKFNGEMKNDAAADTTLQTLSFSGITFTDLDVMLMDLSYVENSLIAFDPSLRLLGTMGIDIIQNFSVLIDYAAQQITLNPPFQFDSDICAPLPMQMETLPVIEMKIEDETFHFVLDTGANTCLLTAALQNRIAIQPVDDSPNVFTVPSMLLGDRPYRDVTAVFADISALQNKVAVDGVIGYHVLSPQRTFLDFANQKLYFILPRP